MHIPTLRSSGVTAFYFLVFFLYVLFGIQPQFIYYYPETCLYGSPRAIAGFLDIYQGWSSALWHFYPGNIGDHWGAVLSHYYAIPWLGTLIITTSGFVFCPRTLDYPRIPRLCEEAMAIMPAVSGKGAVLSAQFVRPETMERFRRFSEVIARHNGSAKDAQDELAGSFGDSYFFYYLYGYGKRVR